MAKGNGQQHFNTEEKIRQLKELMRVSPSLQDTAAFFQCSERTIHDVIKDKFNRTFRQFRDEHMVHTRLGLKRKAIQLGMEGNNTMLIFALKNVCGWKDKHEVDHRVNPSDVQITYVESNEVLDADRDKEITEGRAIEDDTRDHSRNTGEKTT